MLACALFQPFPVWQTLWERPELKDHALITLEKNKVHYASSKAKRAGVVAGMSLSGARSKCHDLAVVETDDPTLQNAWEALLSQFYAFTDKIESPKQGVAYLDLQPHQLQTLATMFSARVATSWTLEEAHALALGVREGEACVLAKAQARKRLHAMPVYLLKGLGLGDYVLKRLEWMGMERLSDLLRIWSKPQLLAYLGKDGLALAQLLYGPYTTKVATYTPPVTLDASYDFETPALEPREIEGVVKHLVSKLLGELGQRSALRLSLKATSSTIHFTNTKLARQPLRDAGTIERLAWSALASSGAEGFALDGLALSLSGLHKPVHQGSLFDKREEIEAAAKKVGERYPGAIQHFEVVDEYAGESEFKYRLVPFEAGASRVEVKRGHHQRRPQGRSTAQGQGTLSFTNP